MDIKTKTEDGDPTEVTTRTRSVSEAPQKPRERFGLVNKFGLYVLMDEWRAGRRSESIARKL